MIDLHCHILPGLDDGALDEADSLAMARRAGDDRIELICATPHIRHDHDVVIHELAERVAQLNAVLITHGVSVAVTAGGEIAEPLARSLSEAERDLVSLGGGRRWLLVEPAPGPLSPALVRLAAELAETGRRMLVAHPERHLDRESADHLEAIVRCGGLVQATAETAAQATEGPLAELIERGLIHVLGTDAHSSHGGREVVLSAGFERLAFSPRLGPHIEWIRNTAPMAIVRGDELTAPFAPGT